VSQQRAIRAGSFLGDSAGPAFSNGDEAMATETGTVYLICFNRQYKHARHYIGFTTNLDKRITDHLCGQGARLIEVITNAGIEWKVTRTWQADRNFERYLKNRKEGPRLCPICNKRAMKRCAQLKLF
jgi:predicted GIY-YIG superfamily endonuclease